LPPTLKHQKQPTMIPKHATFRLLAVIGAALCYLSNQTTVTAEDNKPNVVFILADDLGWSDTTLFETTKFYETPNIERLAERGMTFTRAYSASPLCSPTRSAILTGLNPARTGITAPNCHLPAVKLKATPGLRAAPHRKAVPINPVTRLDPKYYTLGEALKDAGYATGHFGKWHLGAEPFSPLQNGFDVDLPHTPGPGPSGGFVAPWAYPDFDPDTPNEHIEDRMAKEAVSFMKANRDKPFFLNYWMFSVHAPFDAKPDLIKKYSGKVDPNDPQRSPTYAAMIESMDDAVGTLLDTLDRLGIADNTIIVFASDNGGNMYNWVDDTFPTSNAPLRGGKATMYEGGVRGPCSIVWPGNIKPNTRSDEVIQSCDFYPTLLEMLELDAKPDQSFDGISIMPALAGNQLDREAIFTYFPHSPNIPAWLPPAVSIHRGDWKLIRLFHAGESKQHRWKLFDLKNDIGETKNLAADQPELVKELDGLIEQFLVDTRAVRPTPNPAFDPDKYDLAMEGKAEPKGKKKPKARRPQKPVAGWSGGGTQRLSVDDGQLVVQSTGGDPYIAFNLAEPLPAGKLQLVLTMASESEGDGQVFWAASKDRPKFAPNRRVDFLVDHDGKPNTYKIPFEPKNPLAAIRIDVSRGPGTCRISAASLQNGQGDTLKRWSFESSSAKKATAK
jgi:arylsulfatase A-like enzyme